MTYLPAQPVRVPSPFVGEGQGEGFPGQVGTVIPPIPISPHKQGRN
jgi:hypothetical protein